MVVNAGGLGDVMNPTDNDIYIDLQYNVNTDEFAINTNTANPKELVEEFLRLQFGKGVDSSPVIEQETYNISIRFNTSFDRFVCFHDCGNKGLREGILSHYAWNKS